MTKVRWLPGWRVLDTFRAGTVGLPNPALSVELRAHRVVGLAFDVRPVLRALAGRPRPLLPPGRFRRRVQTFSNFLPRMGNNLQQDISPT